MFSACAAGCSSRGSVAAARGDAAALAAPSRGVGRAPELLAFTSGESREMPNMPDGRRVRARSAAPLIWHWRPRTARRGSAPRTW